MQPCDHTPLQSPLAQRYSLFPFAVHAERKAPSSNLLEVCRVQVVCAGSEALSVRRLNDYTGARSCWDLPEGLHCDVLIVFLEAA